jgi:hypothetical protein
MWGLAVENLLQSLMLFGNGPGVDVGYTCV